MNLHEYQSKVLFREYEIPVPEGRVIEDISELDEAITSVTSGGLCG